MDYNFTKRPYFTTCQNLKSFADNIKKLVQMIGFFYEMAENISGKKGESAGHQHLAFFPFFPLQCFLMPSFFLRDFNTVGR